MKHFYLLLVAAMVFAVPMQAQFNDDIESYAVGPLNTYPWDSWDETAGTADDISVTDEEANSGTQSVLIAEGGVIDGLLKLGNKTSDTWGLTFMMYIPSGKSGYFNVQNEETPGVQWNYHVTFNEGGSSLGVIIFYDASGTNQGPGAILGTGSYPVDAWFEVSLITDMDSLITQLSIDGALIATTPYTGTQLGAINFYSNEGGGESNRYYIDDAVFETTVFGVDDVAIETLSATPNPMRNQLTISSQNRVINEVVFYDVLGKKVLGVRPERANPSIDTSSLPSGIYLAQVFVEGKIKTIKLIK
ncbi:T9SS type A sorting domain-containing protein [Altibacter sp. HG106]|uniref:T9SS type A sorting domain-containing protein n=1 Tax=Altibacter sp. HG106 TaxID=3023937 RepID=UPI002350DCDC|nr:T9SS type A sorting domain-containing protein [Altibacter sp. HG106]MDC7995792.1 T9SS type A sorting domain-containing protein [Altibacter sp. HG106]